MDATEDNLLNIVGDGRRAAMDMRLISPSLPEEEDTKLSLAVRNMLEVYHATHDMQGAQLVFCDVSTPGVKKPYDAYTDVKQRLINAGIPAHEIAFIHDADKDDEKLALFKRVRSGAVRFMFGSTEKMGTGTNVQDRLAALHDLDAPWRPSDLEQRMGRIVRQGNLLPEVKIFRYTTEDSFDLFMWETNKRKASYIAQIMKDPSSADRTMSEDTEINFAEVVAVTTGNPSIREKVEVDSNVAKLQRQQALFYAARVRDYLASHLKVVDFAIEIKGAIKSHQDGDTTWVDRKAAAKTLYQVVVDESLVLKSGEESGVIASIMGVDVQVGRNALGSVQMLLGFEKVVGLPVSETPHHNLRKLVEFIQYDIPNEIAHYKKREKELTAFIDTLSAQETGAFSKEQELDRLKARQVELNQLLAEVVAAQEQMEEGAAPEFDHHLAAYLECLSGADEVDVINFHAPETAGETQSLF